MLTRRQLGYFRRHSEMTYRRRVTGRFRGTTDEVIQWAAHKHGIDEDLFRAAAVKESWWRMETIGDNGDSFGLMQIRRPYHSGALRFPVASPKQKRRPVRLAGTRSEESR